MSETKRLVAAQRVAGSVSCSVIGGVRAFNDNPYPVEVTVRRVAERVVFETNLIGERPFVDACVSQKALRDIGYLTGQRVRVTIEPLD